MIFNQPGHFVLSPIASLQRRKTGCQPQPSLR